MNQVGLRKDLKLGYADALTSVAEALKAEGFGVLTTIDVKETLKAKLGVDFRRYTILGACNPHFAHAGLGIDLGFGTMMPCSVVVYEGDDGRARLVAVDPTQTAAMQAGPDGVALANQVRDGLLRALSRVA